MYTIILLNFKVVFKVYTGNVKKDQIRTNIIESATHKVGVKLQYFIFCLLAKPNEKQERNYRLIAIGGFLVSIWGNKTEM